mgnify:CR=1 FL=1
MALEQSILKSTKKNLGLDPEYDAFDADVLTYINASFFDLQQLGIGDPAGFMIEDDVALWEDFADPSPALNVVKAYVYLKVRMMFDPPATSFHIKAIEDQITEYKHTLLTDRELSRWTTPASSQPFLP